jgi:hypothetical protein
MQPAHASEYGSSPQPATFNPSDGGYSVQANVQGLPTDGEQQYSQYVSDQQGTLQHMGVHEQPHAGEGAPATILVQHPPVPVMTIDAMGNMYATSIQPAPTQYYIEQAAYSTYNQATGEYYTHGVDQQAVASAADQVYAQQPDQVQQTIQYVHTMDPQQQVLVVNEHGVPLENTYVVHQEAPQSMGGMVTMVPSEAYVQSQPYEQYYVSAHDPAAGHMVAMSTISEQQVGYGAQDGYQQGDGYAQQAGGVAAQAESQEYLPPGGESAEAWGMTADQAGYPQQHEHVQAYMDGQQQYIAMQQEQHHSMGFHAEQHYQDAGGAVQQQQHQEQYETYEEAGQVPAQPSDAGQRPHQEHGIHGAIGLRAAHSTTVMEGRAAGGDHSPKLAAGHSQGSEAGPVRRSRCAALFRVIEWGGREFISACAFFFFFAPHEYLKRRFRAPPGRNQGSGQRGLTRRR